MENKHKHLGLIAPVINRLAGNSFLIKGWSITIIAALFALAASSKNATVVYVAYFPILTFWALDGYFLRQERLYRKLYDHVCTLEESAIDFRLDVLQFENDVDSWIQVSVSKTLRLFHGAMLVTTAVVAWLLSRG